MNSGKTAGLMGLVVVFGCAWSLGAADLMWESLTDSSYTNAANWAGGALPTASDTVTITNASPTVVYDAPDVTNATYSLNLGAAKAHGGLLTLEDGTLTTRRLTLYGTATEPAIYTQNGGTLSFNSDDTSVWTVGTTKEAAQIVINGGTFAGYHMLQLGNGSSNNNNAFGWWKQTGGATTFGSFVVLGRYVSDWGYMDLSGGTFELTDAGKYMLVGELGNGELNVTGTAQLTMPSILLGRSSCTSSTVTIRDSAVIRTGSFWTECKAGVLTFDGGQVATYADNTVNTFIAANITAKVAAGGANLEIGTGCQATVATPLIEDTTSTGGGLVKTGAGKLILNGQNTYTGATKLQEGSLVLAYPLVGTLEISADTTIGVEVANWTDAEITALLAQVKSAGAHLEFYTSTADATIGAALDLDTDSFVKYGNYALTLTGANTWTGTTTIYGGMLKAKRGVGVPSASQVIVQGGTWAPLDGALTEAPTLFTMPGTTAAAGLSAVGTNLTVNLDNGATLTKGTSFANNLILNDTAADQPLVLQNSIAYGTDAQKTDLAITVNSTAADAKVTLAGSITGSNNKQVYKNGNGTLELTGGSNLGGGWFVNNAGTSNFSKAENGEAPTFTLCDFRTYGGTLNLNADTTANVTGWARFGMGASETTLNVNGATVTLPKNCRFIVGENSGTATANLNSGSLTAGYLVLGNSTGLSTFNQRGGTATFLGTTDTRIGEFDSNTKFVGKGVYNLYDGTLNWQYNCQVGGYGNGVFNQYGGTASTTVTGWLVVGRWGGATGTYNMTGGTYEQKVNGVIVGEDGTGTLNISGTGVFTTPSLRLASNSGGSGTVNIGEGGKLLTASIIMRLSAQNSNASNGQGVGNAAFVVDGGTIEATTDTKNLIERGEIQVGPKGMTLDNGGHTMGVYGSSFASGAPGTLTLTGAGTTTLGGSVPAVKEVLVKNGTKVNVGGTGAKELVHRWSFNGDLTDSVGGSTATTIESGSTACTFVDNQKVKLAGGNRGAGGSLNLGNNLVTTTGPVTFELWCSIDADQQWSKMFLIGSGQADYVGMNACTSTGSGWTGVSGLTGGQSIAANMTGTGYATRGTEFHYLMTLIPNGMGGTTLLALRQEATTGKILNRVRLCHANWTFANIKQTACYMGRSYWNDKDASMTVNEFRIWKGAFTEDEAILSTALGPESLPNFDEATVCDGNVLPDVPSAELVANNYLTHRWSFNDGSYRDIIGGRTAVPYYTVTNMPALNAVCAAGGSKNTSYIDLQKDLLPKSGPVTVELWFTPNVNRQWSSVFTAGSSTADGSASYITLGEYCGNPGKVGKMFVCINNRGNEIGTIPVTVEGKAYHAALTFTPRTGGGTVTKLLVHDLAGNLLGSSTLDYSDWTIGGNLGQTYCYLGRSLFAADPDASVTYDEVRVWNAALSDAQLARNARLGPDTLPVLAPESQGTLNVEAGATVDLQGGTIEQSAVTGAGAVTNGTLVITGELDPDSTLTLPTNTKLTGAYVYDNGDLVTCEGNLDLTDATIIVRDLSTLTRSQLIATTSGTVTGTPKTNLVGTGFYVSCGEKSVRISKYSTVIILR